VAHRGLGTACCTAPHRRVCDDEPHVFEATPTAVVVFWPGLGARWSSTRLQQCCCRAVMTAVLLIVLPLLLVYRLPAKRAGHAEWVGAGLDLDVELLQLSSQTRSGSRDSARSCASCNARFRARCRDMFCLLRLELEVAVQAKAMLCREPVSSSR